MNNITVKQCDIGDAEFIYECRYDPVSNANSTIQTVPAYEEHLSWFQRKLLDPKFRYFKGVIDSASIGFVRFVDTDEGIEVSVCVHPKFRRFGYSEKMLYLAIRERGDITKMYSTIKICNEPSYRTFATTCRFLKWGLLPPLPP